MRDAVTYTVDDPRFSTAQVIGSSMLSLDGDEHKRHREPFAAPYRRRRVESEFGAWVLAEADALVSAIAPSGQAELRSTLAAPLAVRVIVRSLGLVGVSLDEVLAWYRQIVAAVEGISRGEADQPAGTAAFDSLRSAVADTIAADADSMLAEACGFGLTIDEVASNAAVLMFGAIETSEGATANALYHLLSHPEQLADVVADPDAVAQVVEESLRLEPAAAQVDRYATTAVVIEDHAIAAGDYVIVSLRDANRDPAVFVDPDRFDMYRDNASAHLTFAQGPHHCLGLHLARLETTAALRAIVTQLPGIRLVAARSRRPDGAVFRKPRPSPPGGDRSVALEPTGGPGCLPPLVSGRFRNRI